VPTSDIQFIRNGVRLNFATGATLHRYAAGSSGTTLGVAPVILSYSVRRTKSRRHTACERPCSVTMSDPRVMSQYHSFVIIRAGVSKCGARFETLLRGPIQWCSNFWGEHSVMIEIGDVTKRGPKGWRQDLSSRNLMYSTVKPNKSNNHNSH